MPAPELLLIDPMAPFDLAVLLRPAGPDIPVADPGGSILRTKVKENSWPGSHCMRWMGNGKAVRSSVRKARLER